MSQEPMTRAEWRKQQKQKQQKMKEINKVSGAEKPIRVDNESKKRSLFKKSKATSRIRNNEKGNKVDRILNKVIIILVLLIIILCIFIFNV